MQEAGSQDGEGQAADGEQMVRRGGRERVSTKAQDAIRQALSRHCQQTQTTQWLDLGRIGRIYVILRRSN